jgi:general secretion pathway protein K
MRRERGVILISVLVLVALAAVVAATLFFDTAMAARRTAAGFGMEQAVQLAQGAEALAAYALNEDKNDTDSQQDGWAQPYGPQEVTPEVSIEAQLTDLQGRFNLNSLVGTNGKRDENAYKVFTRMLELLELDRRWADLIIDWIDPDTEPAPEGGEDGLYTSQQPPYRAANLPLTSISELQELPGLTREMYLKLAPHVTALPPAIRTINVCTASGIVLDALFALNTEDAAHVEYSALDPERFAEQRGQGCFPTRAALGSNQEAMQAATTERSSWFRLHTWVRIGTAQFALYSLLNRDNGNQVRLYGRSFGTD